MTVTDLKASCRNQRTWISLEEKGIPYQYVEVNPYKKEKHFLGELRLVPKK